MYPYLNVKNYIRGWRHALHILELEYSNLQGGGN